MKIKVNCYDRNWRFKKRVKNIKNLYKLEFTEKMNWWQWNFTIELAERFDLQDYEVWDFIEYIIFDEEECKKGLHKFTGIIRWIERYFTILSWQWIKLQVDWIISLLSDFNINKIYSWNLFNVINEFINDFHSKINISNNMWKYFWSQILKNWLKSFDKIYKLDWMRWIDFSWKRWIDFQNNSKQININIKVNWTFFQALEKIFSWEKWEFDRHFFINQRGEIIFVEEQTKRNIFTLNKNISEINIDKEWEIIIDLINFQKNTQVWNLIILQNINKNLNLSGRRITELAFWIEKIVINAGKIPEYNKLLKD